MPPEEATRVSGIFTEIVEYQEPIIDLENWTVKMENSFTF